MSARGQRAPATPVRIERAFLSRPNHAVPKSTRSACHVGVGLRCPAVRTRVLLISPLARAGGAERAFAALAGELPRLGYDPVVALLERGPLEQWLDEFELIDARPTQPLSSVRTLAAVERLRRLAQRTRAKVVVSSKTRGHIFGGPAARAAGLPAVWWRHEVPRATARLLGPRGHRGSTRREALARRIPAACVICGNAHAAMVQRRIDARTRVATIRPGIPVASVAARSGDGAAVRAHLGWRDAPVVGIVGRLSREKGQHVFLRAAALVGADRPDARFLVVGGALLEQDVDYARRLPGLAAELGLGERVRIVGHRHDPVAWMDALDVVVIASRAEAGPLVAGEAMALGKPIVAARVPGVEEVVHHGRSGLLVTPNDPHALAAEILRVLADRAVAELLSAGAKARAWTFSDQRMAEGFADVLSEVVA